MDRICIKVELSETDVYNSRSLIKVETTVPIDTKADFKGEVMARYTQLANKAARDLVREVEDDVRLNKELRGEPCCPEFKKHMEAGKFDGAQFCKFCGKAISKDLDEKAMAMVGVAF